MPPQTSKIDADVHISKAASDAEHLLGIWSQNPSNSSVETACTIAPSDTDKASCGLSESALGLADADKERHAKFILSQALHIYSEVCEQDDAAGGSQSCGGFQLGHSIVPVEMDTEQEDDSMTALTSPVRCRPKKARVPIHAEQKHLFEDVCHTVIHAEQKLQTTVVQSEQKLQTIFGRASARLHFPGRKTESAAQIRPSGLSQADLDAITKSETPEVLDVEQAGEEDFDKILVARKRHVNFAQKKQHWDRRLCESMKHTRWVHKQAHALNEAETKSEM